MVYGGEVSMIRLEPEDIAKIHRVINAPGRKEAVVKVENGKVVVLMVDRKKI